MTYEICRYIFVGGAILAAVMLVVTILLFIFLKIPTVIGDLSGANARKAIEIIRSQNADVTGKLSKSSRINRERGKITDKISPSGNLIKNPSSHIGVDMSTQKLNTQELVPQYAEETAILSGGQNSGNETTLLAPIEEQPVATFEIEYDITYIHTNEVIA